MSDQPHDIRERSLRPDFDTTAELWDRVVDDITRTGGPCLDTVEQLIDDACHQPARLESEKGQPE